MLELKTLVNEFWSSHIYYDSKQNVISRSLHIFEKTWKNEETRFELISVNLLRAIVNIA